MSKTPIVHDIKKMLGIPITVDSFDTEIIININTVLMLLYQLGVSDKTDVVFSLTEDGNETWEDYLGDDLNILQAVKTYIYLRVRVLFDPPTNAFLVEALERQMDELEWRITQHAEGATKGHIGKPEQKPEEPGVEPPEQKPLYGDKAYIHTQHEASNSWVIEHNLDKYPSVSVTDSGDNVVIGEVEYLDKNTLQVRFTGIFSGKAYLN